MNDEGAIKQASFGHPAGKRSVLDILQSLDLPFILEEDRIRILSPGQAKDFWTQWMFEALADRFY